VKISPYGRKLAEQHQIDWRALVGSGPGGRIVAQDVESAIAGGGAPAAVPAAGGVSPLAAPGPVPPGVTHEDLPISMMRKAIARKMEESKQTVPHFQATRKVRMERLVAAREALNREFPGEAKISVNDLIVKACAAALRQHPTVNSQYLGDRIRRFHTVDISVAVGTDDGLITPIVRNADRKGLREISAEVRELAGRAREKKLAPEEYTGGTFTISNLGMYGITEFNGIINTPQACLLAVSGIVREPVVEGDALVAGQTMNITLSSDHRIVDGLAAAQFLDTLTRLLEHPVAMLL
jgi:pyruvate dehydrogenase E2 component (dihydrolipoamide acetyltransferase)